MTVQAHYRRRTDPALQQKSSGSTLAAVGTALLMLIGLVLVVASCVELQTLASAGWGSSPPATTALSTARSSLNLAQLVPSLLLPLGAVASFVASSLLRCRG